MTSFSWQLDTQVSAIVFDCDGTLNKIEGIDYLAQENGVGEKVKQLTSLAMSKTGLNANLYQERLSLVMPSLEKIHALGQTYFAERVPDVLEIIQLLQRLQKTIYLVSAGINPAVKIFGKLLNIANENIYAVDLHFNDKGEYITFEKKFSLN